MFSVWQVVGHPRLVLLPGDGCIPREGLRWLLWTRGTRADAAELLDRLDLLLGCRLARVAARQERIRPWRQQTVRQRAIAHV